MRGRNRDGTERGRAISLTPSLAAGFDVQPSDVRFAMLDDERQIEWTVSRELLGILQGVEILDDPAAHRAFMRHRSAIELAAAWLYG